MSLVAGIDSSTQSVKVVVCDADTGAVVRRGRASHPEGTECPPSAWVDALHVAIDDAGGLDDVEAVAVGGQQHGMVLLDADGEVVRDALLWNDTRSAQAALDLIAEFGGEQAWADAMGVVPVASFTNTKLRWVRDNEPENAARVAAVCLPHDYLTWHLMGEPSLDALTTDRSDASGTGYWSTVTGEYRHDLLELALGHDAIVPHVVEPGAVAGTMSNGVRIAAGAGDNAGAALGLGAGAGDVVMSIGTSGVVTAIADAPPRDASGTVAGFADATGRYLPLVCTLNAARVLDGMARVLGVSHERLSELALSAPAGCDGLVLVPYLEGERTPNHPDATGALHGITLANMTPAHMARAAFEGVLCGLADGLDAIVEQGLAPRRIIMTGGAAASPAMQQIAPEVLGLPVVVPTPDEYVAIGAARQAAWVASGADEPPMWLAAGLEVFEAEPVPAIRDQYARAKGKFLTRA